MKVKYVRKDKSTQNIPSSASFSDTSEIENDSEIPFNNVEIDQEINVDTNRSNAKSKSQSNCDSQLQEKNICRKQSKMKWEHSRNQNMSHINEGKLKGGQSSQI